MTTGLDGVAALSHLGVIAAKGEDAAKFLQGQLTQDFALLRADEARLAAHCTAKGRMLASFIGLKWGEDEILLVTSRDVLPAAMKRLSMFVLRAKLKLRDATAEFGLWGLAGDALGADPGEPWRVVRDPDSARVTLYPADGAKRVMCIAPAGSGAPQGAAMNASTWNWGEVRSGVATITAPIVEAFVPQMLNYESVGGVNFKKGCYPGQEVVARSQFRGTLKRRAYLAHCAGEPAPGQEVFHESDREQPCGMVAQAAPSPGGGWDAIVSMQVSAAAGGRVTLGAGGPDLQVSPPPYPLLADV